MEIKLFLILGRTGDILGALPIVQHEIASGRRACVMVSREYADVLDGVSVDRIMWDRDWRQVRAAYESVRSSWPSIVVLQQYSTDGWPQYHATDSFIKEMYRIAGKLPLFPLPLKFDRRDPQRESHWIAGLPMDKPIVLLATCGFSSPFPQCEELRKMIHDLNDAHVVDLDAIRAERIYDLLPLFERAACLVTVDSAMLHSAQATPRLPVIALIASNPSAWHGSPAYAGQRLRVRYSDFDRRKGDIIQTIGALLESATALGPRQATA